MVSLASEFPNDNPALHRGVIWVCTEPTGCARPERVASPVTAPAASDGELAVPEAEQARDELSVASEEALAAVRESIASEIAPTKHDSLAPPEDDVFDGVAEPIVVEELEPIEASLEGDVASPAGIALDSVGPFAAANDMTANDGRVDVEAVRPALMHGAPAPAQSEVVLAGTRVDTGEEDAGPALTPIFEEVVASEIPCESSSLPPAPDDPFTVLVCTLADVAIGAGSPHVASLLPGLLFDGRLPEPIDPSSAEALRAAGLWDGNEVASSFVAVTAAWRAILRGTSDDFDACGAAMLDEWAAELLARLLDAPARAPMLRQELRSRGIAAFGLAA